MGQKSGMVAVAVAVLLLAGAIMIRSAEAAPTITVYKSPTCGCCGDWITHLRESGFDVEAIDVNNLAEIKTSHGIAPELSSCHTALIGDVLVEGHVPASVIRKFLDEGSDFAGLAVPGMPVGSPGMETPGQPAQPYDVVAFDRAGNTQIYASFR